MIANGTVCFPQSHLLAQEGFYLEHSHLLAPVIFDGAWQVNKRELGGERPGGGPARPPGAWMPRRP